MAYSASSSFYLSSYSSYLSTSIPSAQYIVWLSSLSLSLAREYILYIARTRTRTRTSTQTYVWMCIYVYKHIYIYAYTCVYTYKYINVYTYCTNLYFYYLMYFVGYITGRAFIYTNTLYDIFIINHYYWKCNNVVDETCINSDGKSIITWPQYYPQ